MAGPEGLALGPRSWQRPAERPGRPFAGGAAPLAGRRGDGRLAVGRLRGPGWRAAPGTPRRPAPPGPALARNAPVPGGAGGGAAPGRPGWHPPGLLLSGSSVGPGRGRGRPALAAGHAPAV